MMFKYMCLVLFITWYQLADCHPASSSIKSIDSMIEKESEAFLSVEAEDSSHKNVRDKRTIGFLRQLFPNLSQIVDRKIQQITRFVFRVIGRLVLRGGGAGAGAGAGGTASAGTGGDSGGNGGRRISITLPTFPPSADDEDEESQTNLPAADTSSTPASDADALASRIAEPASSEASATDSAPAASATDSAPAASADSAAEVAVTTVAPATTSVPENTSATAAAAPVTNAAPAAGSVTTTVAAAATTTANAITTSSPTTQMPSDSDNTVGTGIVKRTAREVSTDNPSSTKKRSPLTDTGKI